MSQALSSRACDPSAVSVVAPINRERVKRMHRPIAIIASVCVVAAMSEAALETARRQSWERYEERIMQIVAQGETGPKSARLGA